MEYLLEYLEFLSFKLLFKFYENNKTHINETNDIIDILNFIRSKGIIDRINNLLSKRYFVSIKLLINFLILFGSFLNNCVKNTI
jgi:hypothetical protein